MKSKLSKKFTKGGKKKQKLKKKVGSGTKSTNFIKHEEIDDFEEEAASNHSDVYNEADSHPEHDSDSDGLEEGLEHKKSLSKLRETDPEFYKFLQENDRKLLQFNVSDSENESEASMGEEDKIHKPPNELEVDSEEESGLEDDKKPSLRGSVVTLAMVGSWRAALTEDPNLKSISDAVKGFHAALDRVTGEESSELKVDGSAVFNAVVELCVMHLQPAVVKFLKLPTGSLKHPEKSKKWVKVKSLLQSYFSDLLKLLTGVASEHIVSVLLKHLHMACPLVACFGKLSKMALKYLTKLWSSGEETVRVLAFLCVLKLCTSQKAALLNAALKLLYIAYIRSSNFVSVNTLPQISFMRRSLACLFTLNPVLSYQHAFLYIRQLAIHLRNAVTIHKKESFQSVYNWQYMQSLRLWVELLCSTKDSAELQQLLYPLVQIIIGCIKLIPTAQYAPLRFHCIQLLVRLGNETDIYIPVLPFIVESLTLVDLNGQHKKVSMKPFDFTCVLRLSKSAMVENGFKDAIIENVYNLLLESTACCCHTVTYPDLIVPIISQLKVFLKECKISKYTSKLKQLLSKIEENSKFINDERNKLCINISDTDKIRAIESRIRTQNPPLLQFWEQWSKVNCLKVAKQATDSKEIGEVNIPTLKKLKTFKRKSNEEESEGVVLFPSDDDSEDDTFNIEKTEDDEIIKKKNRKKESRKRKKLKALEEVQENNDTEYNSDDVQDEGDIVEDLDADNF